MKTNFETQTCSRCNGSGSYSYCQQYGDRCFKCHGSGKTLTRRGEVARAYFIKSVTVSALDLKPGDRVASTRITHGAQLFSTVETVVSIEETQDWVISSSEMGPRHKPLSLVTEHPKYGKMTHRVYGNSEFRIYPKDNEAKIQAALEYQATLTKAGTQRKR